MGFEPTNDFRRCRFSRSAKPLRALPAQAALKTRAKRLWGRSRRAAKTKAQRAKPSQTETRRAKSRPLTRQVSDKSRLECLELTRNGGVFSSSPYLPYSRVGFDHHGVRGLLDAVRAPVGGDGAGLRRQRTGKVTSGRGCPRGATGRFCCRWRGSTSSPGSHRQGARPAGLPHRCDHRLRPREIDREPIS